MDIGDWLARLGLPQYAKAFAQNAVDGEVLAQLTADDLKELGVTLVGHRRKLLNAIECLRSPPEPAPDNVEPDLEPAAGAVAERRHLTVLFCDLAGFESFSARLDPEDLRDLIATFHAAITEAMQSQAGFIAQYLAHGALVYFGYPAADEDDAERALRSALQLREAVQQMRIDGFDMQMRAGLATGLAVVGDLSEGSQASHERRMMGETPNLAARLQASAQPGEIVIDAATRRLTGRLFELAERPAATLKGFAAPVPSWSVLSEALAENRFEALRSGETPLVGREEELELLGRRWEQVKAGSGRVVMISGEPGLGKSRLVAAFQQRIKTEEALELRYFCSPHHETSALYPIVTHLTRAANFAADDSLEQKLEKLGRLAAKSDDLPFLAEALSLPARGDGTTDGLAPQERRQKLFAALFARIDQLASTKPLFLLFEDMHWVDPTTQEVVDLLISGIERKSILLVLTHRPQYRARWGGQANVASIFLTRLRSEDRTALIRSLIGNTGLASGMIEEIAERTDGVPLFVEELTRAVVESGDVTLLKSTPAVSDRVPATLHASLMARLDHLGVAAREVAQVASVIGREFTYEALDALVAKSRVVAPATIPRALAALTESGLVFVRGTPPLSSYTFKHALVHDAAHSTLLRTQRQKLHAAVVSTLVEDENSSPEVLAYHLFEAGDHERAAREWLRAARRANGQSAVREALDNLDWADGLLRSLPKNDETEKLQLDIEAERILPTVMVAGFGSPEIRAVLDRVERLAEQLGAEKPLLLLLHRFMDHVTRGHFQTGLSLGMEFSRRAGSELAIISHRLLGNCYMCMGRLREARPLFDAIIADDPMHSAKLRFAYVYDTRAFALINQSVVLSVMGFLDQAEASRECALTIERELKHPITTTLVLSMALVHVTLVEDRALIGALSARILEYSQKFNMPHYNRVARIARAYVLAHDGDVAAGLAGIEACLAEWLELGYGYQMSIMWIMQVRVQMLDDSKIEQARQTVERALEHSLKGDEALFTSELHRLRGLIALRGTDPDREDAAAEAFALALEIARGQEARLLELRAALSLARLRRDQGRDAEARALLRPVYDWFSEGFDKPDLIEASALLAELSSPVLLH